MTPAMIIVLSVVGAVVVFFITREIWCWYFKLNRISAYLRDIRVLLLSQNNNVIECDKCQTVNYNGVNRCYSCGEDLKPAKTGSNDSA